MKITILVNCYAPENVSGCVLVTELATDLHRNGHQVTVVTGAPNYPYGKVFAGYRNQLFSSEVLAGVRVIRVWSFISPHKTFWRRILNYGTFSLAALFGGLAAGKPDVLLSYSPPLPLGISAWIVSRIWKAPWILQIEDLYPEAAVAAGYLSHPFVIGFFARLARFLYRKASHISLICEAFRQTLLNQGIPARKISMIPVWADSQSIIPLPKAANRFLSQHHLEDKFVILYSGNLGLTSCLEDIIGAAECLRLHPEFQFVLIGEGIKKPELENAAKERRLTNITFLPYQPREQYAETLAAADLGLVTINPKSGQSSLPSKVFNIMASARPVFAIASPTSELACLVEKSGMGVVVPPGQPEKIASTIQRLKNQPAFLIEMGKTGRDLLETRYSRKVCVDQIEQLTQQFNAAARS